jgi:Zn-dependent peptidase ImmA (M78 family)
LTEDAYLDVEAMAAAQGATVVYERLAQDVSGMLLREGDSVVIGVNEAHAESRQRFTVAHELGHLILHRGRPIVVDSVRVNLRDSRSSMATDLEEIEANSFAAELLMPQALVLRNFRSAVDRGERDLRQLVKDLALGFGVSEQAMDYRLQNLGLFGPSR